MSNIFKPNTRFGSLKEDLVSPYDQMSNQSNERRRPNNNNSFKKYDSKKVSVNLTEANFPELSQPSVKQDIPIKSKFIDALKTEIEVKEIQTDKDLVDLEPGWVVYKRDKGKVVKKHVSPELTSFENSWILEAIENLAELYDRRTNEYIDAYGYEEWERIFRYPGWETDALYWDDYGEDEIADDTEEDDDVYTN